MRDPEEMFADYLRALGIDLDADPELADTPSRFTELLRDRFRPGGPLPSLTPLASDGRGDLVVVRGLRFHALCVHHITPFFGICSIAYVPGQSITGFGSIDKLVQAAACRPQLQERFVATIADAFMASLAPKGVVVAARARQMCMELTGTQAGAETITIAARGDLEGQPGHDLGRQIVDG